MSALQLQAASAALVVIDVQRGFDEIEAAGNRRNNPRAIESIALLLRVFRQAGAAVIHIRHASTENVSTLRADSPGFTVKDEARELAGETVIVKSVNSAFIGTDLEARLRARGITTLVIAGVTTNHCVETTTRMAGNLGFTTYLAEDAAWTFDRRGLDGRIFPAELVHAMTMANLHGEFCTAISARDIQFGDTKSIS